jgi:hypothetical protein
VREAAACPHWREVYACTPIDGRLLEGYTSDPEELDRRVEVYRIQGASYALTVGASTAEPVGRVTFLFLTPGGAIERNLSDLDVAVSQIRELVSAGNEVVIE